MAYEKFVIYLGSGDSYSEYNSDFDSWEVSVHNTLEKAIEVATKYHEKSGLHYAIEALWLEGRFGAHEILEVDHPWDSDDITGFAKEGRVGGHWTWEGPEGPGCRHCGEKTGKTITHEEGVNIHF